MCCCCVSVLCGCCFDVLFSVCMVLIIGFGVMIGVLVVGVGVCDDVQCCLIC